MRRFRIFLALSGAVTLAACGGDTAPQTVGSIAPPAGTPTPTHSFVAPTDPKTYAGLGSVQSYKYSTTSDSTAQQGQLYAGDANTVRDSGITVTYNPRDAIFELTISRPLGNVSVAGFRFQDPAHRTDFAGLLRPQAGVPNLPASSNIQYLEAGSGSGSQLGAPSPYYTAAAIRSDYPVGSEEYSSTVQTLFYQKPGTTTKYVTYAGFVRNVITSGEETPATGPSRLRENYTLERATFVFGEQTGNAAVPKTGNGTFTGDVLASVVFNPLLDTNPLAPSYLQWMHGVGGAKADINFATGKVDVTLNATMLAPTLDAYTSGIGGVAAGTAFHAQAAATIDLINKGGFTGQFSSACFAAVCTSANSLTIAGSSVDGAFYGPNGEEIGAGFRIVGGKPDERIDILGAFTGKK